MTNQSTRDAILLAARGMVQARGYGALSFRDLAAAVGVKSASIHYHFPTKGDLAAALADRYADEMAERLERVRQEAGDQQSCLRAYTDIFRATLLNENRMCMYSTMATDFEKLPETVRAAIDRFAQVNIAWLVRILAMGKRASPASSGEARARAIFAAIEGAQLVARARNDVAVYDETIAAYRAAGLLP